MRVPGKVQDILLDHSVVHLPHRRPGAAKHQTPVKIGNKRYF